MHSRIISVQLLHTHITSHFSIFRVNGDTENTTNTRILTLKIYRDNMYKARLVKYSHFFPLYYHYIEGLMASLSVFNERQVLHVWK